MGEKMEEHVFFKEEEILVSSTRIVLPNKIIAMHTVSSITIDKEEIKRPWILMISAFMSFIVWVFNPDTDGGVVGLSIGFILLIFSGILWYIRKTDRNEAVVISLTSGETVYIDNQEVDDIQSVFNAISNAIVFRG